MAAALYLAYYSQNSYRLSLIAFRLASLLVPFFGAGVITVCLAFSIVKNNAWLSALRLASLFLFIVFILPLATDIPGNFSVSFIIDYVKVIKLL
jgi:hypothetical protein